MSRQPVLILSTDALAAALLGAAVELTGHFPHFAQAAEPARAALRRVRPRVVLLDCDHAESCAESFIGPAMMTGARVILFRSPRTERDLTGLIRDLGLTVLDLPADTARLAELLSDEG